MIHYNKVNWKNFAKNFLKFFPIDFQSPIDFSQLHMIRPQIFFQRKENGKVLYISFSGQLLNHQKITPTNGNSEIDISSTYTVQLKHHL